ncbi:hypothetical protein AB0J68_01745 [Micromonospora sp. NPDC049580]|uniref:hypothetical protein n=1 Tax=Micromonospora sp. NPDC049580 TaxID=3154832 RepID=UPI00341BD521
MADPSHRTQWHRTQRRAGISYQARLTDLVEPDELRAAAETRIVWSVPRPAVADARVGWHRLNPKRLRIEFTDGSWLAFTVPIAEPGTPLRELAAALTGR